MDLFLPFKNLVRIDLLKRGFADVPFIVHAEVLISFAVFFHLINSSLDKICQYISFLIKDSGLITKLNYAVIHTEIQNKTVN